MVISASQHWNPCKSGLSNELPHTSIPSLGFPGALCVNRLVHNEIHGLFDEIHRLELMK